MYFLSGPVGTPNPPSAAVGTDTNTHTDTDSDILTYGYTDILIYCILALVYS